MDFFNFTSNTMYKYIGIAVILLFSVYISGQCLSYQNYVIEGLANHKRTNIINKDHLPQLDQHIIDDNDNRKDKLLINKYKSQYEDLLIGLNENTNLQLLENITEYANNLVQKKSKQNQASLDKINKLQSLNNSLNSIMKFLDKK